MTTTKEQHAAALVEYTTSSRNTLRVDRDSNVVRGVKIIGLVSKNGRRYTEAALTRALPMYEGIKVNVDHPDMRRGDQPRSYHDRFGVLRSVKVKDDGLYADLHYNPKHAVAEQFLWDAENAPENLGLSHNAFGKTARKGSETVVEEIERVQSVDLVADPATVRGLFESEEHNMGVSLADVKADKAIVEALRAEWLSEQKESETDKQKDTKVGELSEQVKKLTEALDVEKKKNEKAEREKAVEALLVEAKLPAELATDLFKKQLLEADEAGAKALIADRQAIAKLMKPNARQTAGPQSRSQHVTETTQQGSGAVPADAKQFASLLTSV